MPPIYSVVIPVYNAEETLEPLAARLHKVFAGLKSTYELIFIDDGSNDNSWKILKQLRSKSKKIRLIQLTRNFGQHNAVLCGLGEAVGGYVITMDDDLQHLPEEIPKLIQKSTQGFDVVYGVDPMRRHGLIRNAATKFARAAMRVAMPGLRDYSSFRIMTLQVARQLGEFDTPHTFIDGYIGWVTQSISKVNLTNASRTSGRSGYGVFGLITYTANILTTFSDVPMRLTAVAGSVTASLGMGFGIYLIFQKLRYPDVPAGYTSLMAALLFLSGIILFALGVIGEYLGKINQKTMGRPRYIVRSHTDKKNKRSLR